MCHHIGDIPEWERDRVEQADAGEPETEEELPEFLNEEASDDMAVLTDGGDES